MNFFKISDITDDVDEEVETIKSLNEKYPEVNWRRFLQLRFGNNMFDNEDQQVIVYGQMFFGNFSKLMENTPKR